MAQKSSSYEEEEIGPDFAAFSRFRIVMNCFAEPDSALQLDGVHP